MKTKKKEEVEEIFPVGRENVKLKNQCGTPKPIKHSEEMCNLLHMCCIVVSLTV